MIRGRHRIYRTVLCSWRLGVANPVPGGRYPRPVLYLHTDPALTDPAADSGTRDGVVATETVPDDTGDTALTHSSLLSAPIQPSSTAQPSSELHLSSQSSLRHLHTCPVLFDTHRVIQELQRGGYGLQQAEVLVIILNEVVRSTLEASLGSQLSKTDLELLNLRIKNDIDSVKSSLLLLEKSTVATLRSENEALKAKMQKLKADLLDEVNKVQSGAQLDINLEKSRSKEEFSLMQQKIKDLHNGIGTEAAQLRTQIESQKVESIKYLAGGLFSVITLILTSALGLWRLMK